MLNDMLIVVPVLSDHTRHRCENRISFVYFYNYSTGDEFVIGCSHSDLVKNGENWLTEISLPESTICYKKSILWSKGIKCYDADLCYWLQENTPIEIEYSQDITAYHRWYSDLRNVNDIIPIVNLIEYCRTIRSNFEQCIFRIEFDDTLNFYNENVIENFYRIENSGLPINSDKLKQFYNINKSRLYTEYYPYTATGRPSNRFGGINFAALDKGTGVRSIIEVENNSQMLIEFDYDSHHVRLVAKLIGYELPAGNLHEYFGRQYFKTPVITDEQYAESKTITFRMLYGTIYNEYSDIPFFKMVQEYRNRLWSEFDDIGYIKTPLTKRKIYAKNHENMNASKLFNYVLQGYETDVNSLMLNKILRYLYEKYSKIVLYTYDSFLFLYDKRDGKNFIDDILMILNNYGMRASLKVGIGYDNMIKPKR
jgi:hypothetical protein